MVDAGIGRLLVASLHQGIADVMPSRLPFYEHRLTPPGLRDGKFGLAPLNAVLSFLRLEGQGPYEQTMRQAGRHTGEWAYLEMGALPRSLVRMCPTPLRARWALRLSHRLMRQTFRRSSASVRVRRGTGTVELRGSIFCEVREAVGWPTCVFYASAVEEFLQCFDIGAEVQVSQCKGTGDANCTMTVRILGERLAERAAVA
jgi:predicted hydrocarbon binding protein